MRLRRRIGREKGSGRGSGRGKDRRRGGRALQTFAGDPLHLPHPFSGFLLHLLQLLGRIIV